MSDVLTAAVAVKEDIIVNKKPNDEAAKLEGTSSNGVSSTTPPVLPRGCRPLAHQVAGHRYGHGRLGIGMLQYMDGSILKPVQPPPRGEGEVKFYKELFNPTCEDPVLLTLRPFLPKLLGLWTPPSASDINKNAPNYSYLKLEDACRRFRNPSILDIKIGRVSHDPHADEKKRTMMSARYPPLSELGFQLLGMRISGPSANEAVFYGKDYGRNLTKDRITEGLNLYLSGNVAWKKYIVKAFIQRLEMILSWFESQERYQFYSSSLLLIYEGEFVDGSSDSDEEFIHKYKQLRIPSMQNDSYLATVRRFLNKNLEEERKNVGDVIIKESTDVQTGGGKSADEVAASVKSENQSSGKNQSEKSSTETLENAARIDSRKPVLTTRPAGPQRGVMPHDQPPSRVPPTGHESGYSSEAESKLSDRRASDNLQREFVTSLNRRIEESAYDYRKYRFPPDIVDVRMIDFTHVFEEPKSDDNYIYGLRNLISYFRLILKSL